MYEHVRTQKKWKLIRIVQKFLTKTFPLHSVAINKKLYTKIFL